MSTRVPKPPALWQAVTLHPGVSDPAELLDRLLCELRLPYRLVLRPPPSTSKAPRALANDVRVWQGIRDTHPEEGQEHEFAVTCPPWLATLIEVVFAHTTGSRFVTDLMPTPLDELTAPFVLRLCIRLFSRLGIEAMWRSGGREALCPVVYDVRNRLLKLLRRKGGLRLTHEMSWEAICAVLDRFENHHGDPIDVFATLDRK